MRSIVITIAVGLTLVLAGCAGAQSWPSASAPTSQAATQESSASASAQQSNSASSAQENNKKEIAKMKLNIDGTDVDVAWEENPSVAELMEHAATSPITAKLHKYGGFEQVGPLGTSLATSDRQMTTEPGDIVLYEGNQISIFYGSNSWAYTKLGHITNKTADELTGLLGNGDVSITIQAEKAS